MTWFFLSEILFVLVIAWLWWQFGKNRSLLLTFGRFLKNVKMNPRVYFKITSNLGLIGPADKGFLHCNEINHAIIRSIIFKKRNNVKAWKFITVKFVRNENNFALFAKILYLSYSKVSRLCPITSSNISFRKQKYG